MECIRTVEILRKAQELIRDEKNWKKGGYCTNGIAPYCAIGAVSKTLGNVFFGKDFMRAENCLHTTAKLMGYRDAEWLNDNTEHSTVMTLFNLTIQFLEDGVYK
jgi:hypothetical protein